MINKNPLYYAKILLFGEYGIIKNSMGLSIPYNYYQGGFKQSEKFSNKSKKSNDNLRKYLQHLKELHHSGEIIAPIGLRALEQDLNRGFYFNSSIPEGYGIGSSGALCAAIYNKYSLHKIDPDVDIDKDTITELKNIFGQMESYFHGKSSGLDPLVCYLKLPIVVKSKDDLGTIAIREPGKGKEAIFLLNSGRPGKTHSMVYLFMEKMKNEGFRNIIKEQFVKYNDICIRTFLKGDTTCLFENLKKLSYLILKYFTPMIPLNMHELWIKGIETSAYYLKLCGSGGGGFLLGFAPDYDNAREMLKNHHPKLIYRF